MSSMTSTKNKKLSKGISWMRSSRKSWRRYMTVRQDELKKYQDITNKKSEKTQKKLNELREKFNKHQHETKESIKEEINDKRRQHKL
jgi:Sec-independent protein translocase protein TatA